MNDSNVIVWIRMVVRKLLGIRGGVGNEGTPLCEEKETEIQLTLKCRKIQRQRENFSNNKICSQMKK
jgi:hypothetical protein